MFGFLKNLSVWIWDLRFCMKVIVFALKQDWKLLTERNINAMESPPGFDADDLGLGEQLTNVRHSQAVEEIHQDDHDKEDEGQEVSIGKRCEAAIEVDRNVTELRNEIGLINNLKTFNDY